MYHSTRGIYAAGFFNLLGLYAITVGLLAVAMFAMHGAIFLHLKTTGELCERTYRWTWRTYGVFVLMYLVVTIATWLNVPRAMAPFQSNPLAWLVVAVNLAAVIGIPCALYLHRSGWAFMASCLSICAFILLLGLTLFPNLVTSQPNLENSLTIYNAASSQKTLSIMLVIAVIGMPFVLTYTAIIYWVFRGRVAHGETSSSISY